MKEKPFWAYDLEETLTDEGAEEIANAIYRSWTGEDLPQQQQQAAKNDADNRSV